MTHGGEEADKHRYLVPSFFASQSCYRGGTFGQDLGRVAIAGQWVHRGACSRL